MDGLSQVILDLIRREAVAIGSRYIEKGADLLRDRLRGEATDEQILEWLREAQRS